MSSISQQIKQIAREHASNQTGDANVLRFLQSWWSDFYNLPLKDPTLLSYTYEELIYEYYIKMERRDFISKSIEAESDKIEVEKWDEAEAWANEEERKELEMLEEQKNKASSVGQQPTEQTVDEDSYDPNNDPEAKKWMDKHMEQAKEDFGEDFGEDLKLDMD